MTNVEILSQSFRIRFIGNMKYEGTYGTCTVAGTIAEDIISMSNFHHTGTIPDKLFNSVLQKKKVERNTVWLVHFASSTHR